MREDNSVQELIKNNSLAAVLRISKDMLPKASQIILNLFWVTIFLIAQGPIPAAQANEKATSLGNRIAQISEKFLGASYSSSPLGEESGIDQDPLIRFDSFDCTTYIETVGALALTKSLSLTEITQKLNQIRYAKGIPSFLNRNHFTSADWIPENVALGNIEDATKRLFPFHYKTIRTVIDRQAWLERNFSIAVEIQPEVSSLDILPITEILNNEALLKNIPQGAVVNFIVENPELKSKIGTDLDVVHQGLLIWKDDELYLRHARNKKYGVAENQFVPYLKSGSLSGLIGVSITPFISREN